MIPNAAGMGPVSMNPGSNMGQPQPGMTSSECFFLHWGFSERLSMQRK
jgi:hypothetical protein